MTQRVLLQLDPDEHASAFDSVVAIDSGVDQLLRYGGVTPDSAVTLTHGAIFTRSPKKLANTAIFVGGSDVSDAEAVLAAVRNSFVGPLQVSTMLDPNGANTTAVAAVWCATRHLDLAGANAVVLGGTGPVGQRVARLLARTCGRVTLTSRSQQRAEAAAARITAMGTPTSPEAAAPTTDEELAALLADADAVFACGAVGVCLLPESIWSGLDRLQVVVDLNAVPPLGVGGLVVHDYGQQRHGAACYGALGVGGPKMKIHRAAVARLFDSNTLHLDADEILTIARSILDE